MKVSSHSKVRWSTCRCPIPGFPTLLVFYTRPMSLSDPLSIHLCRVLSPEATGDVDSLRW